MAVLSVLGFHAFAGLFPGGYVGVDVFFVISGFLISGIIVDRVERGGFSYFDFYARRIRRIFPALILVLGTVLIAGWILFLPDEYASLCRQVVASVLFSANILFWHDAGYFDSASVLKPLLHLWSLGVEEQFYIFWPFAMVLIGKLDKRRSLVVCAIGVLSFALNVWLVHAYPVATFYLPFTRFWELMLGAALAVRRDADGLPLAPWAREALSAAGLGLIVASVFLFDKDLPFPGWFAAVPTLGAAAIIAAGSGAWLNRRLLGARLPVFIGLVSYPLYLWHWPILAFLRTEAFGEVSHVVRAGAMVVAFGLAVATYYLAERPIRFSGKRPRIAIQLAATMAALGLFGAAALAVPMLSSGGAPTADKASQLQWSYWENQLCDEKYPFANKHGWWFCVTNTEKPPSIVLVGNSFANHLYPGLVERRELAGQGILSIGTCPPTDGIHSTEEDVGENPCAGARKDEQDRFVQGVIARTPSIRYAIVNSSWPRFTDDGREADYFTGKPSAISYYSVHPEERALSQRQIFLNGLERRISFLEGHGIRVILFVGTPRLPYDVRGCVDRPFRRAAETCTIPADVQLAAAKVFGDIGREILARHPNMLVFDPMAVFCDAKQCRLAGRDTIYLRDTHHLSVAGSRLVAADFIKWARVHAPGLFGGRAPQTGTSRAN